MPSHTFAHTALSRADPQHVWVGLQIPETWERIGGVERVLDARHDEQGRLLGFTFQTTVAGQPYRGEARLGERREAEHMSWLIVSPDIRGSIVVDLGDQVEEGTPLHVSLTVIVEGLLGSLFFPAIAQALGRGFPEAVEEFAASFGD